MRKRITDHYCDRCGQDFKTPRDVAQDIKTGGRHRQPRRFELCASCADAFADDFMTMKGKDEHAESA